MPLHLGLSNSPSSSHPGNSQWQCWEGHCQQQTLPPKFHIRSGVRQGDPLAPILFILSIEPLLCLLEEQGVENQSHCDDLAIVASSNNLQDIHKALATYELSSGAKLNTEKSFIITQSSLTHSPFPISREPRRYLGFFHLTNWHVATSPQI